jgi:excisionase family DNA binding protein
MNTQCTYFSITDVAIRFAVNPRTVYRWIKRGKLKAIKFGKQFRITEKAIQEFITK